jgi:hypothetical protein
MFRRLLKAALTLLVAIPLVVAVTPNSASASGNGYVWACWIEPGEIINGGCGKFHQYGEIVVARDNRADGWGTRAQIQKLLPDSSGVLHWVNHSSACFDDTSTGNTANGGMSCNYSINEGVKVRLHVWASNSGVYKWHVYSPSIEA